MPVLTFENDEVYSQLKARSEIGENWHLISKDILSPTGAKHRAVMRHKLENSKKPKNFSTSIMIEKQLRKSEFSMLDILKSH